MSKILIISTELSLRTPHSTPPPPSNSYPQQSHHSNSNNPRSKSYSKPFRPCSLCTYKNFDATHYALSKECGVRKLSSADIIKILDITRSCPSCGNGHSIAIQCRSTFGNNQSRFCTKGCKHNGYPLHFAACKHNDEAPSCTISVNKVNATGDAERSIPLVETRGCPAAER